MTVMMQTASAGILKGDTQELNFDIRDNASMGAARFPIL